MLGSRSLIATGEAIGEFTTLETAFSDGETGAGGSEAGVLDLLAGVACCKVVEVGGVACAGTEDAGAGGGGVGTRGAGAVSAGV